MLTKSARKIHLYVRRGERKPPLERYLQHQCPRGGDQAVLLCEERIMRTLRLLLAAAAFAALLLVASPSSARVWYAPYPIPAATYYSYYPGYSYYGYGWPGYSYSGYQPYYAGYAPYYGSYVYGYPGSFYSYYW